MKRWKKIAIGILVLVAISQTPFLYRHWQIARLSRQILSATPKVISDSRYKDLLGVIHVHTSLGGHSKATLEELVAGSKGLDYVVITEHTANLLDTAALTLNGVYDGTLFVGGNELDTHSSDRMLLIPGTHEAYLRRNTETPLFLPPFQKEGRLAFVTYPDRFHSWTTSNFDGVEVFNLNTATRNVNYATFIFDVLWSYRSYPELALATHLSRPDSNLEKYDGVAKTRKVTLFAGSDAHSNLGFHLLADDTGKSLLALKFDDYASVFRIVRTHVLLESGKTLTQQTLLDALRAGHCYIGFDVLGASTGFSFTAGEKIQGDEAPLAESPKLSVRVPIESRIVLLRDGVKVSEASGTELSFAPKESGSYRVEVYRDSLGDPFDRMPWILSNPIYVW